MQVVQLTAVPPPTALPATIVIPRSAVEAVPRSRYSWRKPSPSRTGMSGSGTYGAASRTSTSRPASARRAATSSATRPRAHDHDLGLELQLIGVGSVHGQRGDQGSGGGLGGRRRVADLGPGRVGLAAGDRIGPGQEQEEALEGLERRAALREAAGRPVEQQPISAGTRGGTDPVPAAPGGQVAEARVEHAHDHAQLAQVGRIGHRVQGLGGGPTPARVVIGGEAGGERLRQRRQGPQLAVGPARDARRGLRVGVHQGPGDRPPPPRTTGSRAHRWPDR